MRPRSRSHPVSSPRRPPPRWTGRAPAALVLALPPSPIPATWPTAPTSGGGRPRCTGGTVTDTHTAAAGADGQEFALLTADGGALVFYTDAAEVTITPPAGSLLRLTVPGFYSASQPLTKATVSYLEQFAAYDPPAGGGAPRVVADYSGITGKN